MQIIKVFPDCMSTGLWNERGVNIDEDYFTDALTPLDFIALKYWHEAWEFWIQDEKASDDYKARWNADGKWLCEKWNAQQGLFQFNYTGDY